MAFENATGSIFIYTKLAPQPSSETANSLTAQVVSGSANGEEKPKICWQCFPNNFILRRAKANQGTQGTRADIHTWITSVRTFLHLISNLMNFIPEPPMAECQLPSHPASKLGSMPRLLRQACLFRGGRKGFKYLMLQVMPSAKASLKFLLSAPVSQVHLGLPQHLGDMVALVWE